MVAPTQSSMEPEPTIRISNNDLYSKSPPSKKRGRSVHFAGSVDVHVIESRRQFSREEIQNCFLSKRELDQIRWDIRACLQKMLEGGNAEEDEELRGLESYAPNKYLARIQRMRLAVRTLIKQQEFGELDDRWLLHNYSALTEVSVSTARVRGMKDQQPDPASPPFSQIMVR
mmetsp:Transcript_121379/g.181322  ORF Transcript_121379/g.181322 Transcript_121379/m.181322 type:complete len:172 (-) Transcript_121379:117-632(-)|eukprot:CAMPEP_0117064464 /NCGR_PEP_ID=MMETSP0472-20121206/45023_1 /TAXON_ID=693140 ORGANISM="Tiarina fusus, Strain LIS" /NCGR_SAMPLE_ID=MMETSP0472 /ASSEMBLY_ACC=CAM_ASM_000603 /LENGTH=171 /DNA_ID=CAMNT_0004784617 /DNA_START=107 /DNA_END=622 /DNA_ORIENTATION=+